MGVYRTEVWRNKGLHRMNIFPSTTVFTDITVSKWLTVLDSPSVLSKPQWNMMHFSLRVCLAAVSIKIKAFYSVFVWVDSLSPGLARPALCGWLSCCLNEWEKDCHLFPGINNVWVCTFLIGKESIGSFVFSKETRCHVPTVMDMSLSNQALWSS